MKDGMLPNDGKGWEEVRDWKLLSYEINKNRRQPIFLCTLARSNNNNKETIFFLCFYVVFTIAFMGLAFKRNERDYR